VGPITTEKADHRPLLEILAYLPKTLLACVLKSDRDCFSSDSCIFSQAVSCSLRRLRGKTTPSQDGVIAGLVAGMAMVHYRSPVLALYALVRIADVSYFRRHIEGFRIRLNSLSVSLVR